MVNGTQRRRLLQLTIEEATSRACKGAKLKAVNVSEDRPAHRIQSIHTHARDHGAEDNAEILRKRRRARQLKPANAASNRNQENGRRSRSHSRSLALDSRKPLSDLTNLDRPALLNSAVLDCADSKVDCQYKDTLQPPIDTYIASTGRTIFQRLPDKCACNTYKQNERPIQHAETSWGCQSLDSLQLLASTCRCPFLDKKGKQQRRKVAQRPFCTTPHPKAHDLRDPVYCVPLQTPWTVRSVRRARRRHADPFQLDKSQFKDGQSRRLFRHEKVQKFPPTPCESCGSSLPAASILDST